MAQRQSEDPGDSRDSGTAKEKAAADALEALQREVDTMSERNLALIAKIARVEGNAVRLGIDPEDLFRPVPPEASGPRGQSRCAEDSRRTRDPEVHRRYMEWLRTQAPDFNGRSDEYRIYADSDPMMIAALLVSHSVSIDRVLKPNEPGNVDWYEATNFVLSFVAPDVTVKRS